MRILVVDDEDLPRFRLLDALESCGHAVMPAVSGKEALQVLERMQVDLVITDVVMPEMDGLELLRAMRRSHPQVKSIVLSASDYTQDELFLKVARVLGAAAAFRKSVSVSHLLMTIDTVCRAAVAD